MSAGLTMFTIGERRVPVTRSFIAVYTWLISPGGGRGVSRKGVWIYHRDWKQTSTELSVFDLRELGMYV